METLRDRKRRATRSSILAVAEDQLRARGIDGVTMDDLATEADVSVGTLYSYFGSKIGLLVAIFEDEIEIAMEESGRAVLLDPGADPHAAVKRLVDGYVGSLTEVDPDLLAEVVARELRGGDEQSSGLFRLDVRLVEQMTELLEHFGTEGAINPSVDERTAAELVYSAFVAQLLTHLATDGSSKSDLRAQLHREVDVAFTGIGKATNRRGG